MDWIYWSRQIIGLVFGLIWGIIPLTGMIGLIAFGKRKLIERQKTNTYLILGLASSGYVYLYCNVMNIDDEEHGGIWEIVKEGFMTNLASFLVVWIITYSSIHYDETLMEKL